MQGNVKYSAKEREVLLHLQARLLSDFELIDCKLGMENKSIGFLISRAAIVQSGV